MHTFPDVYIYYKIIATKALWHQCNNIQIDLWNEIEPRNKSTEMAFQFSGKWLVYY